MDDDALIQALMSGRLSMAGLDTLDREPVQKDHPLLSQPAIADRLLFTRISVASPPPVSGADMR